MKCAKCLEKFNPDKKPGALIFSPPDITGEYVKKIHICRVCWDWTLKEWIKRRPKKVAEGE